jgi:nitrate reductase cytochrome c-type subunit
MIKEAIQYLIGLGAANRHEIGGQIFSDKPLHAIHAPVAEPLVVRNLSGLVEYVLKNYDNQPPMLVHVASPMRVDVYSTYNRDMNRHHYVRAEAQLPEIPFRRFIDVESFNILLQSCFVPNDDRARLLAVVGNIQEENVVTVGDSGVAQQVTAKTGVATVGNVIVPNPVMLKPYRTFVEIEQPESLFVFRMQKGPEAALFEADGGAWKLEAIIRIREYLDKALAEPIVAEKVRIIS